MLGRNLEKFEKSGDTRKIPDGKKFTSYTQDDKEKLGKELGTVPGKIKSFFEESKLIFQTVSCVSCNHWCLSKIPDQKYLDELY